MPSPFPGMDPFIEDQEWSDFHLTFTIQLQAQLASRLDPRYYVRVDRRTYVEHLDDDMPEEQRESFLKIHQTETREVVTVLEVLSPSNKRPGGDGRREYLHKRRKHLSADAHLYLRMPFWRSRSSAQAVCSGSKGRSGARV
jgi:hypothetical protein